MEFRLLVEAKENETRPCIQLEGRRWTLTGPLDLEDSANLPQFACISYLWGPDREPDALLDGETMSTRTRPCLTAAIRSGTCHAYWADHFCVPRAGPARQSTLEQMGYIYSRATEVLIVLDAETMPALHDIVNGKTLADAELAALERDGWVSSVWTYQEIVNGGSVWFVGEALSASDSRGGSDNKSLKIDSQALFSVLGSSLRAWQKRTGAGGFATIRAFPHLSALQDLLADWLLSSFERRSALRIFSNITAKKNADPANYFYAILGALTASHDLLAWNANSGAFQKEEGAEYPPNLADKVMAICERKRDFSFIFSAAPRDPKRPWRPAAVCEPPPGQKVPAVLRPVFAWNCDGEAQRGHFDASGRLVLEGVCEMQLAGSVGAEGRDALARWLCRPQLADAEDVGSAGLAATVFGEIHSVGFDGEAEPFAVQDGLIFVLEKILPVRVERFLVSAQVGWTIGAPGLVQVRSDGGGPTYAPCMFLGTTRGLIEGGAPVLL